MQIINFTPLNVYSCQFCGKEFESKEILCINEGLSPLCSNKCLFGLYYNILSTYSEKNLSYLAEASKIKDFDTLSKNSLVFELTKLYPKPSLSSINSLGSNLGSIKMNQTNEPTMVIKTGSVQKTLIYKGFEPVFEPEAKDSLGGLGKWL